MSSPAATDTGAARRRRTDLGVIVALSWLFIAIGVTAVFGGSLGLRGLIWLSLHHVVCVVAVTHEMWRGWKRRKARLAAEP
jgi:hypothetical protein